MVVVHADGRRGRLGFHVTDVRPRRISFRSHVGQRNGLAVGDLGSARGSSGPQSRQGAPVGALLLLVNGLQPG